jgi:CRP-like cAMP-binding protein
MDHPTYSPQDSVNLPERAPLTRLRASARSMMAAALPATATAHALLLPDAKVWGGLFGGAALAAAECAALNEVARARRVSLGSLVFSRGDRARALVLVTEGDVALGVRTDEGGFRTERHMHGPSWLDVSAGWLDDTHALDARAMSAATIVDLPHEALLGVLDRCPALARRLITSLAREVRALAVNTHDLMHKDAPARLAAWLSERCTPNAAMAGRGVVQLPMRKRDIASQLAITPETLSRLMRSFSGQGIITVAGYTVHVLDPAALSRLARA